MAKVVIYTTTFCPFCVMAKRLLEQKKVEFEEVNLTGQHSELEALKKRTNFRTVPQIFIDDEFIGGFQELSGLDSQGELDKKLRSNEA